MQDLEHVSTNDVAIVLGLGCLVVLLAKLRSNKESNKPEHSTSCTYTSNSASTEATIPVAKDVELLLNGSVLGQYPHRLGEVGLYHVFPALFLGLAFEHTLEKVLGLLLAEAESVVVGIAVLLAKFAKSLRHFTLTLEAASSVGVVDVEVICQVGVDRVSDIDERSEGQKTVGVSPVVEEPGHELVVESLLVPMSESGSSSTVLLNVGLTVASANELKTTARGSSGKGGLSAVGVPDERLPLRSTNTDHVAHFMEHGSLEGSCV
mmetsp:Transcript_18458/g.34177  ORF Transcript_18458/g.34177 Transcript_18458/m.34177 type:complete len:264 (-) Transcript_18458:506-1297(-)